MQATLDGSIGKPASARVQKRSQNSSLKNKKKKARGKKKSHEETPGAQEDVEGEAEVKEVVFILPAPITDKPKIIIAGLDPPANSCADDMYDCWTSRLLTNYLGCSDFVWIDLSPSCVQGSVLNDAIINRKALYATALKTESILQRYQKQLVSRIHAEVEAGNLMPVVFFAGSIVNKAFGKFTEMKHVKTVDASLGLNVYKTGAGVEFLALIGHVHPCSGAQSCGDPTTMARVSAMLSLLLVLVSYPCTDADTYQQVLATKLTENAGKYSKNLAKVPSLLGVELGTKFSHLKTLPWHRDETLEGVQKFADLFAPEEVTLLLSKPAIARYSYMAGFQSFVIALTDRGGNFKMTCKQFVTFMSGSVATRYADPKFMMFLKELLDPQGGFKMTTDNMVTFMCGSVATRCADPKFIMFLKELLDANGKFRLTVTETCSLINNSFARKMTDPRTPNIFAMYFRKLGKTATITLFSKGVFCSRLFGIHDKVIEVCMHLITLKAKTREKSATFWGDSPLFTAADAVSRHLLKTKTLKELNTRLVKYPRSYKDQKIFAGKLARRYKLPLV